ncbi:mannose-ethanolamine phosphotransferase gpi13, partial [Kickxella alabastrina]
MDEPNFRHNVKRGPGAAASGGQGTAPSKPTVSVRGHWLLSFMLIAASTAGFWLFSNGFLLSRMVLPDHSQAATLPFTDAQSGSSGPACEWYPAKFERTIVLVVDAMRVDFATWSDQLNSTEFGEGEATAATQHQRRRRPYHNKMPVINSLNKEYPEQTMLYRFRADPPTTTLQRLKGLTTGQLPTFIDAGSNFAGSAISEDNWLQAMRWKSLYGCNGTGIPGETQGSGFKRNLVFLGDDTWISLFPEELSDTQSLEQNDTLWNEASEAGVEGRRGWARVRPFPSLNVWDLDTVDDGVLSRLPFFLLPPEHSNGAADSEEIRTEREQWRQLVKQTNMLAHSDFGPMGPPENKMVSDKVGAEQLHRDWDVIVAHTLGVDHCGHRFGPDHHAISQKLTQMNQAIELIVRAINRSDKPTSLYVFGDHGMDPKGDHGGDSPREVDAALWVYSNKKWNTKDAGERINRVLEATSSILDNIPMGAAFDEDLRSSWWLNTHLSDDYGEKDGARIVDPVKLRSVPQIDLVSTLSLSLGLHIPFNNLGAVIPEFFASDYSGPRNEWGLLRALRLNTAQVIKYLETYIRSSKSHGFSEEAVLAWRDMYERAETSYRELSDLVAHNPNAHRQSDIMMLEEAVAAQYFAFLRVVLGTLRQMWAQFDPVLIISGLVTLLSVLAALVVLYICSREITLERIIDSALMSSIGGGVAGAVAARALGTALNSGSVTHISQLESTIAGFAIGSVCTFSVSALQALVKSATSSAAGSIETRMHTLLRTDSVLNGAACILALMHCLAFTSNSFTFNEDSIVLYLLQTLTVINLLGAAKSLRSSATDTQKAAGQRALVCALIILGLNRISSYSTVCREEQLPGCTPTFYGMPSASISSISLAAVNAIMVWLVPFVVQRFLRRSRSDRAMVAKLWVSIGMRVSMGMSAAYWVLDSIDGTLATTTAAAQPMTTSSSTGSASSDWGELRIVLARMAIGIALGGGFAAWYSSPFCLDVEITDVPAAKKAKSTPAAQPPQQTAVILGYGNAYGAAYLIFATVVFSTLYLVQQPMGGIMLSLLFIKIILCAELFDSMRDTLALDTTNSLVPVQMTMMAMLAYLDYFSTGHQFTLVSIQWSTAFVGIREMQLVVCGAIVAINTLGSFVLTAACVPMVVLWNESLGSQILRLAPDSYVARIT